MLWVGIDTHLRRYSVEMLNGFENVEGTDKQRQGRVQQIAGEAIHNVLINFSDCPEIPETPISDLWGSQEGEWISWLLSCFGWHSNGSWGAPLS